MRTKFLLIIYSLQHDQWRLFGSHVQNVGEEICKNDEEIF